ncbi:MAG: heavy metal translocating P-type ATPase [Christensenellaceae bacterium]|nr:heavy metal translocating P-type ATPase [Christensenellaceae bacterium]
MKKQKYTVTGMTCSACQAGVERAVNKVEGVAAVAVNLLSGSMNVEYDESVTDDAAIIAAVTHAGYGAAVAGAEAKKASSAPKATPMEEELKGMRHRLLFSFIFFIPLMYISMGHMVGLPLPGFLAGSQNAIAFAMTQLLLSVPVIYVNRKFFYVGFKALFHGSPNMDTLVAIGSSAALFYGIFAIYRIGYGLGIGDGALVERYHMDLYFESAVTILTLITLGKFLETRSKGKTGEAISKLMDLAPKTAIVLRGGVETEIPVEDVQLGDTVIVRPGASVPVDGVILEGSSSLDQSALTGEPIPVEKGPGDKVIAASINNAGYLRIKAEKVGSDTTLAQIIALVEEAGNSKAPISKLADRISRIFVPTVISIAVAATVIWLLVGQSFEFALSIGIAVLVISCPCALGLATPVAIMVGTGKGAEYGVLIKNAEALELAHTVKTVVLDKTGTITEGKPRVTDILPRDGVTQAQLLQLLASLEKPSEPPLAGAILARAAEDGLELLEVKDFSAVSGRGIIGRMEGRGYIAGNAAFMEEHGVWAENWQQAGAVFAEDGKTPLYLAREGEGILGAVAVADVVRPTSAKAIARFKEMGIDVVMLTGDNARTAAAIQRKLGISKVIADVLPQDKEREIRRLQEGGNRVAMVGDGINDAPALARADVGIAIGAGTDIAIESANIVLMKGDLLDAVTAIELSRAVIRNIRMNLFWAFFYNTVGIPLAAGVHYPFFGIKLNPMIGAAAMSMSSVCVVTNALRLKFFRPTHLKHAAPAPAELPAPAAAGDNNNDMDEGDDGIMKKIVTVNGMHCPHCQASVEKALAAIEGVSSCKVNLEKKTATVSLSADVADQTLLDAVTEAGFEPVSVATKKGIFG